MKPSFLVPLPLMLGLVVACSSSKNDVVYEGFPDAGPDEAGTKTNAPDATTSQCTAERAKALAPIASVSTGDVSVVPGGDATEIYVDATAGGINVAPSHPRTYIKFDGTKAAIDDNAAFTSTAWDLALKRTDIYTNSGDAGPGQGGAILVQKEFDAVTAADASSLQPERFFDANCNEVTDDAGFLQTTFEGWYDYDQTTNIPSAKPGVTFVVKAADGTLYKLAIQSNTGLTDGGMTAPATAYYLLEVKKL